MSSKSCFSDGAASVGHSNMNIITRRLLQGLLQSLHPRLQARINAMRLSNGRASFGRGVYVHSSVQMLGRAFVRVGTASVLGQDCWLNVNHPSNDIPAIEIGDYCFIGRRNFFSSGRRILFGSYVLTANDCHFLGSSHVVNNPLRPCITTGTTDSDTILVGHNTFFGADVRVIGNVSIGHGCVIGACSVVTNNIPPFSQAAGFPATVRRRYSFPREAWVPADEFTSDDEQAIPAATEYLVQLRTCSAPRMPYLAAGSDMGNF